MANKYLKWNSKVVGIINDENRVELLNPNLNPVVSVYTQGRHEWSSQEFRAFLADRIVSRHRRDIEKVLYRCGLIEYDEVKLAEKTRAFNAKDLFWIAFNEFETMETTTSTVFKELFIKDIDMIEGSINAPDGVNIKSYGVSNGNYGIFKKRLHPTSTDVESEVAVYNLSKLLGVRCCPAWLISTPKGDVAFSKFEFRWRHEFIVHVGRFFKYAERTVNQYLDLVNKFPAFRDDIRRMIILDFVTRQTDRHLSNLAVKYGSKGVDFYSLYDNGRGLFHEDSEQFISEALGNIEHYSSEFGQTGNYLNFVQDISREVSLTSLVNLNIRKDDIFNAYFLAGLRGTRLEGAVEWTDRTLRLLRSL